MPKVAAILEDIFLRRHPWRINFVNETVDRSDLVALLRFLARRESFQDGDLLATYETTMRNAADPAGDAFAFGAGRMALYAILEAMDIGPSDEIIVPPFTCDSVICALLYRACVPVYADIEPSTFNLDVSDVRRKVTRKTKAIIAQHTFGVPCDLEGITRIASVRGIRVIEDCALAMGSSYKGRPVGAHADAAIFSMERTKMLSTMFGGVAFTRHPELARRLRACQRRAPFLSRRVLTNVVLQMFSSYALNSPYLYPLGRYIIGLAYRTNTFFLIKDDKTTFRTPRGYPCRYSNLQACLAINQLQKLPNIIERRRSTVARYRSILTGNGVRLNAADADFTLRFPLLLRDRDRFCRKWSKYFEVGTWFDCPALGWTGDPARIGYERGSCPAAEFVHERIVNFPTHQRSARMQQYLFDVVGSIRPVDVAEYHDEAIAGVSAGR